jgi:hypothetical protein
MEKMLAFKKIDLWIQVALSICAVLLTLIFNFGFIMLFYLGVGGWQLISCIIHYIFKRWYISSENRNEYLRDVVFFVFCSLLLIPAIGLLVGFLAMVVTPFFAIWYMRICQKEIAMLKHKALIHLK